MRGQRFETATRNPDGGDAANGRASGCPDRTVALLSGPGRTARHVLGHGRRLFLPGRSPTLKTMSYSVHDATAHLLRRLNEVLECLEKDRAAVGDPNTLLADVLDSMAMVEFLAVLAEDYGVTTAALEECVGRRFGTVADSAVRLHAAGWMAGVKSELPS